MDKLLVQREQTAAEQHPVVLTETTARSRERKKKKTAIISVTSLSSAGKCVISACLQVWHTCSSSFRCNVCLQEAGRLPATVTGCHRDGRERKKKKRKENGEREGGRKEKGREREREREGRGEVEKRAPLCAPFFQKSLTGLMPSLPCM